MVNSADFGKRIQKIMDKNDLNASSFAEAIQVGRSSISHILSGRNKPSLDLVMNIVQRFPEVDLYWLLNGKGVYPKTENSPAEPKKSEPVREKQTQVSKEVEAPEPTPSTTPDLFSTSREDHHTTTTLSNKGKNISKVILLYTDGSFKEYVPE